MQRRAAQAEATEGQEGETLERASSAHQQAAESEESRAGERAQDADR